MKQTIDPLSTLLDNFVFLRKKHGFSKKEMSRLMGIGIKSYDLIEKGILPERLTVVPIFRLGDHFKIPYHLFFEPFE